MQPDGPNRYHFTNENPVEVTVAGGETVLIGDGWLAISEDEYRTLSRPSDEQIKQMVSRFLAWRLPENFHPDGGISFKPTFNEHTPWPMKSEPVGTNLFDYQQATAMVRHMLFGDEANG